MALLISFPRDLIQGEVGVEKEYPSWLSRFIENLNLNYFYP